MIDTNGKFYLGRVVDAQTHERTDNPLLYDSDDLVTHAVVVGMTGSGKTGLCLDLLEEAALNNIPAHDDRSQRGHHQRADAFPRPGCRPIFSRGSTPTRPAARIRQWSRRQRQRPFSGATVWPMGHPAGTLRGSRRACPICHLHPRLRCRAAGEHSRLPQSASHSLARKPRTAARKDLRHRHRAAGAGRASKISTRCDARAYFAGQHL
jgi:hypothetical protein